ncbi:toll-like receptor 13 [Tiliqua scincoides]|uniref:toll-like receptor 13 n=1 Tax=Tiliqua scincoides TaxID=71010 RepID=UPI0034635B9F
MMSYFSHITLMLCVLLALSAWLHRGADSFGFRKCILSPSTPGLAICAAQSISSLSHATSSLPNSTRWLNASRNSVANLTFKAFSHLPRLSGLYLDHNHISAIESNAFQNLGDLEVLDLSWNWLASVGPTVLVNLKKLRELHLDHNRIATLHPSLLMSQMALQELHLSYNNLSCLGDVAAAVQSLPNLTFLNLDFNKISTPCAGPSWIALPFLRNLSLNSNGISTLDLSNCSFLSLQKLNLTYNNLSEVRAESFRATPFLVELSLDRNPVNISQLINVSLPNLTTLHLSSLKPSLNSSLPEACSVFRGLPSLTSLDIKHSNIKNSQLMELGSCTNLTWLDLSTTQYKNNVNFHLFPNLEFLSLDKCKMLTLQGQAWGKKMNLRTLILRRNSISNLMDRVFSPLTKLSYLDLSKNHLTNIYKGNFFGMAALRTLLLQGCQITAVTRTTFQYARKMQFLDLRDNSIRRVKNHAFEVLNHLETLLLSGNKILTVQNFAFKRLNSLKSLFLDHNLLYKLGSATFTKLNKLEILDLSHNNLFAYNKHDNPSPFAGLRSLCQLDLGSQKPEQFIYLPDRLFQGLENLQYLSLKNSPSKLFSYISFVNLTGLKSLDISEITVDSWRPTRNLFQGLHNLSQLWMESSSINDLPERIFSDLTSLEQLSLRKNHLKNISKNLLHGLRALRYLDISENYFNCSCDNLWFQNWSVSDPNTQVALLGSYRCLNNDIFIDVDLSFCFEWGKYFFAATTVVTLLFLLGSLISAKFGWTLRHGYYLLRGWGYRQLRRKGPDYQYDAYISCCGQDQEWVVNNLLSKLEEQGEPCFRLCFGPRDFAPGEYYMDNVQNGISQSRKTLCLVSNNYLENEWCSMEIHLACSKIFYQGQDPLVVVFMEEIPNYRLSPYHRLRKLMKQESYLTWPENPEAEEVFWTRLREALGPGEREQEQEALFNITK